MEEGIISAREKLRKYGQEHVLDFYNELEESEKVKLLNQINNINFELLLDIYNSTKELETSENDLIEPISSIDREKLSKEDKEKYESIGIKAIKEGKLACLIMAGRTRNTIRP